MSTLAAHGNRVLFIENTGVRALTLQDLPRLKRRLLNWGRSTRGFRRERENLYLYEDFSDRAGGWRWLLTAANQLRRITPHLSHRVLYLLCQMASPLIYRLFTVPFRILRRIPGLRSLAAGFPFRHATGLFSLVGDLYDRFSAPIEWRYNRVGAEALFQDVGLQAVITAKDRGWMVTGSKAFVCAEQGKTYGS